MTLIPIAHARTLRSAAEAEALFRALREKTIALRGLHTADPARIARVVEAVRLGREETISFEGGKLAGAREALDRLAQSAYGYLDVRTAAANLRIWPDHPVSRGPLAWVHHGEDTDETTSIPTALDRFHTVSGDERPEGFVMRMEKTAKQPLIAFLTALGGTMHAVMEVDRAVARELTELYAGETLEWGAFGIFVRFPGGEITGYLKTPKTEDKHRAKWHARIDGALRKAKLS